MVLGAVGHIIVLNTLLLGVKVVAVNALITNGRSTIVKGLTVLHVTFLAFAV